MSQYPVGMVSQDKKRQRSLLFLSPLPPSMATVTLATLIVAIRPESFVTEIELENPLLLRTCLLCSILLALSIAVLPQGTRPQRRAPRKAAASQPKTQPTPPAPEPSPEASPETSPVEEQELETLKTDTNLVTVPVIATTVEGNYIPDLRQDEFSVSENDVKQELAFFATVSAPFHVVLMLDTSGSTKEKLGLIRQAAISFVDQLQRADRVKVISFDDQVRDLNEFTNDRAVLRNSINKTMPGAGTKLYDAFEVALSSIKGIRGRKAIVLFSDGVDYYSDQATFDGTLHWLDEEGVIVYPIRYDTRAATARLMREQMEEQQGPQLPTIGVIRAPGRGTTEPTFPSDEPDAMPTGGQRRTGPLGLPSASEILRRRREAERDRDRDRDRDRNPDRYPSPDRPSPGTTDPRDRQSYPVPTGRGSRTEDEAMAGMLDLLYLKADSYLTELAQKSGGRLLRADTLGSLPDAFAKIAAELRTQYAIGYYPTNKARDGQYRKIKVTSVRKGVVLRARPGYRAPRGG
jgi:Mg-chelatase subunit ChlD